MSSFPFQALISRSEFKPKLFICQEWREKSSKTKIEHRKGQKDI